MSIPYRQELEQVLRAMLAELEEYDYIMGDIGLSIQPWRVLEGRYEELRADDTADTWLAECALISALATQWGVKDGSHTISDADQRMIVSMVDALRNVSSRARRIARAFDLVVSDDMSAAEVSSQVLSRDIRGGALREGPH